ncbi:MAG: VOC family protein [Synergistaceae bacterium]|jgi:catechol 2,3-dioxygenase-like lactoylglutathione lyase family enzyme|nr:VOC family protein [Synergistaceae bacterium]
MITGVDHIDLRVINLDETIAFLTKIGLVVKKRFSSPRHSVEMALPGEGQVVFEIREADDPAKAGIHHVAFKQADKDTASEFKKMGINFTSENRLVAETGRTVSTFTDDNGLVWQLID